MTVGCIGNGVDEPCDRGVSKHLAGGNDEVDEVQLLECRGHYGQILALDESVHREGEGLLGNLLRSGRGTVTRDGEFARCREGKEVGLRARGTTIVKTNQIEPLDCGIRVVDLIGGSEFYNHSTTRGMAHGHLRLSVKYCFDVTGTESNEVGW